MKNTTTSRIAIPISRPQRILRGGRAVGFGLGPRERRRPSLPVRGSFGGRFGGDTVGTPPLTRPPRERRYGLSPPGGAIPRRMVAHAGETPAGHPGRRGGGKKAPRPPPPRGGGSRGGPGTRP